MSVSQTLYLAALSHTVPKADIKNGLQNRSKEYEKGQDFMCIE